VSLWEVGVNAQATVSKQVPSSSRGDQNLPLGLIPSSAIRSVVKHLSVSLLGKVPRMRGFRHTRDGRIAV